MRNIAIITARSGSKGLKDKNIKNLNGKPLLSYSIEAAKKSGLFDEIIVSTDSKMYADIAKKYGANVPFLRSKSLSDDSASSWDVLKDILNKYESKGIFFDTVTLLQPTSPLRTSVDIIQGFNLFIKKSANLIVGVCEMDHSPLWANTLPENHSMENFMNSEIVKMPRQNIPKYYRVNGAIYIIKTDFLLNTNDLYSEKSYALIMDKSKSVDIDDEIDFRFAEMLLQDNEHKHCN
jgi:CMP-N,N'-diacetyllegionaminic acid synthase